MATPENMKTVASRIVKCKEAGNQVVVVVSAPGDETDELIALAKKITDSPDEREMDVLRELAKGATNREIAMRLHLAEGTVKNYVTTLLQKLGVADRTRAALKGRELGLL